MSDLLHTTNQAMDANSIIVVHSISAATVLIYKISVLIVAFLFAKLGHSLLVKGISGEFKFSGNFQGVKADLISASPGTFFVLVALILLSTDIIFGSSDFYTEWGESNETVEADEAPPLP